MSSLFLLFAVAHKPLQAQATEDCELAVDKVATDEGGYWVTIAGPFIELHTGPAEGYPIYYVVDRGT